MVTIDNLANRYSLLPSEILERGSTFDLQVLNISTQYDVHMRKKNDKTSTFKTPDRPELTEAQMNKMIARVQDAKGS